MRSPPALAMIAATVSPALFVWSSVIVVSVGAAGVVQHRRVVDVASRVIVALADWLEYALVPPPAPGFA